MESKFPGGVRSIFHGSQGLKLSFLRGQDKFSKEFIPVRASQDKFFRGIIRRKLVSLE